MRALLPVYCRPLGYFIIALALFLPFIFLLWGKVTDANLLFYKECSKLLMMMGALMIIFALTKNENKEIEQVRNKSTRNAIFLTVLFIFGGLLFPVGAGGPPFGCFFSSAVCSTGWRRVTSFRSILLLFSYFLY